MAPKRAIPFSSEHALPFGVKIVERDSATKTVVSASCLFCAHFGREEKTGSKRIRTVNVMYFKKPFRADIQSEKAYYFDANAPVVHRNTINHTLVGIVDVIIGDMLFQDGDSNEEITKERALNIFEDVLDPSEGNCDGCDDAADVSTARYCIHLKNPAQFYLISNYLSVEASFRMASRILAMTKESTGLTSLGSVSEGKVAAFARYVCALKLQSLKHLLARVWTFLVGMDMSTLMATSYLDIRIRLHWKSILNFHLLAILMFSQHTAEQIFLHAAKSLDVLAPSWKNLLLSISTDGERKMTVRVQGVATRFEQSVLPGFYRICCGLHQLDIKLQCFFASLMDEQFYSSLTSLILYLRRQQNLINDLKTKAPTVSDTRWESKGKVATKFKTNRVGVLAYLGLKKPSVAPSPSWWIVLMFIVKISAEATITFRSLEGLTTIVSQQREGLQRLHDVYVRLFKASGPLSVEDANAVDHGISVLSKDYQYSLQLSDVTEVLEELGLFVAGKIEETGAEAMTELVKGLAICTLKLIAGVISIVAERDSSNEAAAEMPLVLSHQLVMLRGREFGDILKVQTPRLRTTCSITEIDIIEQEFAQLQSAYHRESSFKAVLDACGPHTSFKEGWKLIQDRFCFLREFCGGLATAFPGTSFVESDFSIVKWEKDVGRASLTYFSLEGILHAKQFKQMRSTNVQ
ncbi:hypothetical protein MPTK1_7g14750 [Marchantia polymorpha subsp. ruderalis]|uniref:Uncharacterized protein n=2 Tax=Marchantia polymorpha TaxID=3197 RepID=A0AAF6BZN2_MARPO|nr:hypothetical protein MARPO_0009s0160 [Marchantia polymorpha]BBN17466.1 hypothetical protein Mp_7g14750 [Marchantia polymorpha subsp. ruderalis]|eukprot:PTQ47072.1 hypothetical protein MARPO_0009s0160 [Marchantia polymorpha]